MAPVIYNHLSPKDKRTIREAYVKFQGGKCYWCKNLLSGPPTPEVLKHSINMKLFPPGMLRYPIHLQHDHSSGLTEGAVHAYCNCVMWQYYGR